MDRTTLTAALKPLGRRGLVKVAIDDDDKRSRRLVLTPAGRAALVVAMPLWEHTQTAIEGLVGNAGRLRAELQALC